MSSETSRFLISFISFIVLGFYLTSCTCSTCGNNQDAEIPVDVLTKAKTFITANVGESFYNDYITPDFSRSKHLDPDYYLVFNFIMPEKPFVNNLISFTTDSTGKVYKDREIIGVPDCKNFPENCEFNIDEDAARNLAVSHGLEEGIKDWKIGFVWDSKFNRYTWHVLSTLTESGSTENFRGSGKEIVIDPGNGNVLAMNDWRIN